MSSICNNSRNLINEEGLIKNIFLEDIRISFKGKRRPKKSINFFFKFKRNNLKLAK